MEKILITTHTIYTQALVLAEQILANVSALSKVTPQYVLSREQVDNIIKIGYTICKYNALTIFQLEDEFSFDFAPTTKCYINLEDGDWELHLGLQMLCAIWEQKDVDLSWYFENEENGSKKIYWDRSSWEFGQFKQVDELLS